MSTHTSWDSPPGNLRLSMGEAHVWRVPLTQPPTQVQYLNSILSPEEHDRVARCRFECERQQFIVMHGALREILASYVGHDPAQLRFQQSPEGKPSLAGIPGTLLRFNLSRSENLGLIALALGREVGVDVEKVRPIDLRTAPCHVSASEVGALQLQEEDERLPALFSSWTLKEAYMKASGAALSLPLDTSVVLPWEPSTFVELPDPRWTLHPLHPGPGYVGALAADGNLASVHCWEYQGAGLHGAAV